MGLLPLAPAHHRHSCLPAPARTFPSGLWVMSSASHCIPLIRTQDTQFPSLFSWPHLCLGKTWDCSLDHAGVHGASPSVPYVLLAGFPQPSRVSVTCLSSFHRRRHGELAYNSLLPLEREHRSPCSFPTPCKSPSPALTLFALPSSGHCSLFSKPIPHSMPFV